MSTALNEKGILYTWGAGTIVAELNIHVKTYGVRFASVGEKHVAFINVKDRVFVWGDHSLGQNNIPKFKTKPVEVVSGNNHIVVMDSIGDVYVWGDQQFQQSKVPVFVGGVIQISAKGNQSAVLLDCNKVISWGEFGVHEFDFDSIATVSQIELGSGYLAIVLKDIKDETNEGLVNSKLRRMVESPEAEKNRALQKISTSKYQNSGSDSLAKNTLDFFSKDGTYRTKHSKTEVFFEGSGNRVTVINDGVSANLNSSCQRIIFKGDGENVVIKQSGGQINMDGEYSEVVIDLANYQTSSNSMYSIEYLDDLEENMEPIDTSEYYYSKNTYYKDTLSHEQKLDIINSEDFVYKSRGNINEWPIMYGYYIFENQPIGTVNEKKKLDNFAWDQEDIFETARLFFYLKENEDAMYVLDRCYFDESACALALYHIYTKKLFGYSISTSKANEYKKVYEELHANDLLIEAEEEAESLEYESFLNR